jgi:AcrR family transcriptional regulator
MVSRTRSRTTRAAGGRLGGSSRAIGAGAAKRQDEIIDAAIDMFHARSYAETSVEDVANAVGILKGSLYYYIDSKEDLLFRILDDVHVDVEKILEDALGRADLPPLERLALYVSEQVKYNAKNLKKVSIYYHDIDQLSGARLDGIKARRKQVENHVVGLLREAQQAGEIDADVDVRLAANCTFAPVVWMYTWYRPGGKITPIQLGEFCANFVINGLRAGAVASTPR